MDELRDHEMDKSHRESHRAHRNSMIKLTPLSLPERVVRAIIRYWPLPRGRTRITNILTNWVSLPSSATFEFDYGVFVDTSLANWPNGYRSLFLHGRMEDSELRVWECVLERGDAVIDCGANYGYWTLVSSRLVGQSGSVFAFEGNPPTASRLEQNVQASSCSNVRVYKCAVAAQEGTAFIHTAKENPIAGHASLHPHEGWQWDEPTPIQQVAVDSIASSELWPTVRLIKLDIEGAELSALRGMERLIKRDQPFITVEWNTAAANGFGYHPREIIQYLLDLGYTLATPRNGRFQPGTQPAENEVSMMWFVPRDENVRKTDPAR